MSFDVYLEKPPCEACGRGEETVYQFNLTHNVNSIVEICLTAGPVVPLGMVADTAYRERSWGRLEGWPASEALPIVKVAVEAANDPARAARFKELEPENGWGDAASVRRVLQEFHDALVVHPTTRIRTWG